MTARRSRREDGFTLIELLAVMAVLSILAAIVLLNVLGVRRSASSSACGTDLQTIQTAVGAYVSDHGGPGQLVVGDMTAPQGAEPASALTLLQQAGLIHENTTSCGTLTLSGPDAEGGLTVSGSP